MYSPFASSLKDRTVCIQFVIMLQFYLLYIMYNLSRDKVMLSIELELFTPVKLLVDLYA